MNGGNSCCSSVLCWLVYSFYEQSWKTMIQEFPVPHSQNHNVMIARIIHGTCWRGLITKASNTCMLRLWQSWTHSVWPNLIYRTSIHGPLSSCDSTLWIGIWYLHCIATLEASAQSDLKGIKHDHNKQAHMTDSTSGCCLPWLVEGVFPCLCCNRQVCCWLWFCFYCNRMGLLLSCLHVKTDMWILSKDSWPFPIAVRQSRTM